MFLFSYLCLDIKHIESYSSNIIKSNPSGENKRLIQNKTEINLDSSSNNLTGANLTSDDQGEHYLNEDVDQHKAYKLNIYNSLHTTSDNFDFLTKQSEKIKDRNFNQRIDIEIMNKKPRISKNGIKDIIDAQTHNTFDDTYYDDKNMLIKMSNRRRDLGLDLNQTWGDGRIIDNSKWLSIQKHEDIYTSKEKSFRSNNLLNEISDRNENNNIENKLEFDNYQTELKPSYEMKRKISKTYLKPETEKPGRAQGRNVNQIKHFSTQQSFREYQPKQKEVSQSKK